MQQERCHLDFNRGTISLGSKQRVTLYWGTFVPPVSDTIQIPAVSPDVPLSITKILEEFIDLFQIGMKQAQTNSTRHKIPLKRNVVINKRCYPMSPEKKRILQSQIEEMLTAGVIEPSASW